MTPFENLLVALCLKSFLDVMVVVVGEDVEPGNKK
jgi:hypothetical protein